MKQQATVTRRHSIPGNLRPSEVRSRILDQHRELRAMLGLLDEPASQLERGDEAARGVVVGHTQALRSALLDHLAFEDRVLVPALRDTDGFGDVRADHLLEHHREQRVQFDAMFGLMTDPRRSLAELARTLRRLLMEVRDDMDHEEADLLNPRLLCDVPMTADSFTG